MIDDRSNKQCSKLLSLVVDLTGPPADGINDKRLGIVTDKLLLSPSQTQCMHERIKHRIASQDRHFSNPPEKAS
jgi:hypothetical protein